MSETVNIGCEYCGEITACHRFQAVDGLGYMACSECIGSNKAPYQVISDLRSQLAAKDREIWELKDDQQFLTTPERLDELLTAKDLRIAELEGKVTHVCWQWNRRIIEAIRAEVENPPVADEDLVSKIRQMRERIADLEATNKALEARYSNAMTGYDSLFERITSLESQLAARDRTLADVRAAAETLPHVAGCQATMRNLYIHIEPCPFWTKGYCLSDRKGESIGCIPAPCDCFRSRLLALLPGAVETGQ